MAGHSKIIVGKLEFEIQNYNLILSVHIYHNIIIGKNMRQVSIAHAQKGTDNWRLVANMYINILSCGSIHCI